MMDSFTVIPDGTVHKDMEPFPMESIGDLGRLHFLSLGNHLFQFGN